MGREIPPQRPLTLGTAGHVDHGKTALVRAMTGVATDRLPEEARRGISIALGYAPLKLPSGRQLSVIDAPGHERYVRTMVAGSTGINLFLMVVAADDGVMPQTREHAAVLRGLRVRDGVIAVTKADLIDPEPALEEVAELLPGVPAVPVSAVTNAGIGQLLAALDAVAATTRAVADAAGPPVLHVDRVFTMRGAGTVVTGTLWRGAVGRGDSLCIQPGGRTVRVRNVQVHDVATDLAAAGQRVAVNLVGVDRLGVKRGDVLTSRESDLRPTYRLDVAMDVLVAGGTRLHVHHGTRDVPARVVALGDRYFQLRLEQPLIAAGNDRILLRQLAPPDTLGGGVVLDARPRKHGSGARWLVALQGLERGEPPGAGDGQPDQPISSPRSTSEAVELTGSALELEQRLRDAGHEPPIDRELDPGDLAALRSVGRAVRVGPALHYHPDVLVALEARLRGLIEAEGSVTLARFRDELATSRKFAQALLQHFDAARVTFRRPDDTRVLRQRRGGQS